MFGKFPVLFYSFKIVSAVFFCARREMRFHTKFIHLLQILTIFCNYVAGVMVACDDDDDDSWQQKKMNENCVEMRTRDNENSLNEWENLHSFDISLQVNMTRWNLQSINQTFLKSIDKARTASIFDLSINEISFIENGTFENFYSVRILIMRVNNLREITSQSFRGLMMLEELYLSENAIFDVKRDSFRNMENLHTIDLSRNSLYHLNPFIFMRNYRLINIYLNYNFITELPIIMPSTQFLKNLNVTGNRFVNMTSLMYYTNIQSLDLSDNPLSSATMTDVVKKESDASSMSSHLTSSNESNDSNNNDSKENIRQRPFSHQRQKFRMNSNDYHRERLSNLLRIDSMETETTTRMMMMRNKRAARMSSIDFEYNGNIQYLMDTFRPGRISEEALQSLIKMSLNENVSESHKVMIDVAIDYYKSQNPYELSRISKINDNEEGNEKFSVASFVHFVRNSIRSHNIKAFKNRPGKRTARNVNERLQSELSVEQFEQLYKYSRINQMEYFTCRNCSLHSIDFLVQFTKLKYVDVSSNMIKSVDGKQLVSLKQLEYLLASDNNIVSLNFTSMLKTWPKLHVLNLNNNPQLSCDLVRKMLNTAYYLYKVFKLEVNKCK